MARRTEQSELLVRVLGTIASLGTGVDENKWKVGQNVIIQPIISCLKESCDCCASGAWNVCPFATSIVFLLVLPTSIFTIAYREAVDGVSEYIALDTRYVHILPEGISLDVGATLEPPAVTWYGVKKSGFKSGQSALIVGNLARARSDFSPQSLTHSLGTIILLDLNLLLS